MEGTACFERIAQELSAIMREKGYKRVSDFRGKLKGYEKHVSQHVSVGKTGEFQCIYVRAVSSRALCLFSV